MQALNIVELKDILEYVLSNNKRLQSLHKKTSAIEILGESGIGKTSSLMQLSKEQGIDVVKLNLAQIEELGDLVGFPMKEFKLLKEKGSSEEKWVPENLLKEFISFGYFIPDDVETRMGYATPAWLPKTNNGGILILDDWNRADPRFIQAVMELIDRGEYISWKLPPNWTICLTANPDSGDYNVQSVDNAQRTRYISFELEFNKDVWAKWAEEESIDGRCINFVLLNPEIVSKKEGVQKVNARSLVTFFNTISGIKDFSTAESLTKIDLIAGGCFSSTENEIGTLFTLFINNKLDKLIQPEEMLLGDWEEVSKKILSSVYDKDDYRADIGSTLTTRFFNFIDASFKDKTVDSKTVQNRIIKFVESKESLLTEDLLFSLLKELVSKHPTRVTSLLSHPKVVQKVILTK